MEDERAAILVVGCVDGGGEVEVGDVDVDDGGRLIGYMSDVVGVLHSFGNKVDLHAIINNETIEDARGK